MKALVGISAVWKEAGAGKPICSDEFGARACHLQEKEDPGRDVDIPYYLIAFGCSPPRKHTQRILWGTEDYVCVASTSDVRSDSSLETQD
jgi:hypothetical protein